MDSLRFTLLIIGLLIVAGIYFKYRTDKDFFISLFKPQAGNKTVPNDSSVIDDDLIPVLTPIDDEPDIRDFEQLNLLISTRDNPEELVKGEKSFSSLDDVVESGQESLLIVFYILPPAGHLFSGEGIHAVMTSAGLLLGEQKIYDYFFDNQILFSIANAVEPGVFEKENLSTFTTPGLALFMQLPGPMECRKALDTLLDVSNRLATALTGDLCDENRNVMTKQTLQHLKDKIDAYRLKQKVSQRR